MTESTRKKVVYVGSALALAWAGYIQFIGGPSKPVKAAVEQTATAQATPAETPKQELIDVEQSEAQSWGADPFREWPGAAPAPKVSHRERQMSFTVSGILHNPDNPMAFVNGRMVKIGDVIDGAKIVAIDRTQVTLLYQGKQRVVTVKKG